MGSWVSLVLCLNLLVLFGKRLRIGPNLPQQNSPKHPTHVKPGGVPGAGGEPGVGDKQIVAAVGWGHRAGLGGRGERILAQPVRVVVLMCFGLSPELTTPLAPTPGLP